MSIAHRYTTPPPPPPPGARRRGCLHSHTHTHTHIRTHIRTHTHTHTHVLKTRHLSIRLFALLISLLSSPPMSCIRHVSLLYAPRGITVHDTCHYCTRHVVLFYTPRVIIVYTPRVIIVYTPRVITVHATCSYCVYPTCHITLCTSFTRPPLKFRELNE